jgi:hypothetical protein
MIEERPRAKLKADEPQKAQKAQNEMKYSIRFFVLFVPFVAKKL